MAISTQILVAHTPGKWSVDVEKAGQRWKITAPTPVPTRRFTVTIVVNHGGKADEQVAEADARLIAAAPELLRVARILESFRQCGADSISFSALMHDGDDTLGQAVNAAIAKTEGR